MARKEKKYHFIYKTTNLLSGKYYIGMHSTDDLNDGYMGSGNRLRLAVRKHGKENFKREVLEYCETREELGKREKEVVNLDEISKIECMNLTVGGEGGYSKKGNDAFLFRLHNDVEFREKISKETSETNKRLIKEGKLTVPTYDWLGKKHSEETKKKMSEIKGGTGTGETNSQHGNCWITKDGVNKKIKKEELDIFLIDGWKLGRISKINGEDIKNSKLTSNNVLKIKKMLSESITQDKIAEMFDVKRETISKIKRGLIWKQIRD